MADSCGGPEHTTVRHSKSFQKWRFERSWPSSLQGYAFRSQLKPRRWLFIFMVPCIIYQ